MTHRLLTLVALVCLIVTAFNSILVAQNASPASPRVRSLAADAPGEEIYETVLGDATGAPTTGLLSATQYLRNNRLLPRGFDKATAPREVGVFGEAARDGDFTASGDRVRYAVEIPRPGPHSVEVELRYHAVARALAEAKPDPALQTR